MSKMFRFTFIGAKSGETTVTVPTYDEAAAREAAMTERWGPCPQYIGQPPKRISKWAGHGLDLINVKMVRS